ncbi:MAG TPA: hypothetical protein DCL29_05435 [Eubacterium sp.]|nr:hypothetical protein [Eubacterium sp.]
MFDKVKGFLSGVVERGKTFGTTHQSEIYMTTGAVSVVAGVIFACKATLKCDEIIEEHRETMDKIHKTAEDYPEYENTDKGRDIVICTTRTVGKMVKNYAGAGLLIVGGLYLMIKGYNKEKSAKEDALVALNTYKSIFDAYRGRVREKIGEEAEEELYLGGKVNRKPLTGPENEDRGDVKELNFVDNSNLPSPYAVFFDRSNVNWCDESKYGPDYTWYNVNFLRIKQSYVNTVLNARGYVLLSDVLKELGIEPTGISNMVGWLASDINGSKDGYIDFGIYDINNPSTRQFINGDGRNGILLDFNVDGIIIDRIDTITKKVGCR